VFLEENKILKSTMKIKSDSEKSDKEISPLGKTLSDLIKFKKKLSTKKPKLIITLKDDFKKETNETESEQTLPQFFVHDIQRAALYVLIGTQYKIVPSWCTILRPKQVKSLVLITVNNLSENDYQILKPDLQELDNMFSNKGNNTIDSFPFISSYANKRKFYDDFTLIPSSNMKWITSGEIKQPVDNKNIKSSQQLSRVSLLLNVEQMLKEDFPLPFDQTRDFSSYKYSMENYSAVDDTSPIFGLDCEMCYNIDGEMEVVWIAIVDENLKCVYESFVKPGKPVENYLTHITGVTSFKLKDVYTKLADVREAIKRILPSNAIICGQSLNNDLHALKMFHPYIIDTSVIFNLTGGRDKKTSLKNLTSQFLKERIQQDSHNPVHDAIASIKLVLLKLRQGLEFGDVIINGIPDGDDVDENSSKCENIFNLFETLSVDSILIDRQDEKRVLASKSKFIEVNGNKNAYKALKENANSAKFVWCQLYFEKKFKTNEFLKNLKDTFNELNDDSFLMLIFTGDMVKKESDNFDNIDSLNNYYKGRFFIKHKNDEYEILDEKIKNLYNIVKNKDS
jgi:hypothetical protein